MSLTIPIDRQDDHTRVGLEGRLDSATSIELEPRLLALLTQPGETVILDCSELAYIASSGLRVVLVAAKRAQQQDSRLLLCSLQPQVREVFEISGFLKILTVVDSYEEARRAG